MNQRRRRQVTAGIVLVFAISAVVAAFMLLAQKSEPRYITISTGSKGGTYFKLGKQYAGILRNLGDESIIGAEAVESKGAGENVDRLLDGQADVGFVMAPMIANATDRQRQELRVLSRLYTDVVQIVVREQRGTSLHDLNDLPQFLKTQDKKIFLGAKGSGTRLVADILFNKLGIRQSIGPYISDIQAYDKAADQLVDPSSHLGAAFFVAGVPTTAVEHALSNPECRLVSMKSRDLVRIFAERRGPIYEQAAGLKLETIPAHLYLHQRERIETVGAYTYLACHREFPPEHAYRLLDALFDNAVELLAVHTTGQDIKLINAFSDWKSDDSSPVDGGTDFPQDYIQLHDGAIEFRRDEDQKLLIATGPINGKYYQLGRTLEKLLRHQGISARLLHTDGSLENALLLSDSATADRTLAFMQLDVALATRPGMSSALYGHLPSVAIPEVENLRQISQLHEELLCVFARREVYEKLGTEAPEDSAPATGPTLRELLSQIEDTTGICVGSEYSGTRPLSLAILNQINDEGITENTLPVKEMINRLHSGDIDVAFVLGHQPSNAFITLLNDPSLKLLSMEPLTQSQFLGTPFQQATIAPNTYGCQLDGEDAIETLSTRAMLVMAENSRFDVGSITKAIVEGSSFFGSDTNIEELVVDNPSLPLHPDARKYYQEAELLPPEPIFDWWNYATNIMAVAVVSLAGYRGLIELKRHRTANEVGRRILGVELCENEPESVRKLAEIRDEILLQTLRRFWRAGEINQSRWRYLHDLIDDRIREARENSTLAIVAEMRATTRNKEMGDAQKQSTYDATESRIWRDYENGELNDPEHATLLGTLQLCRKVDQDCGTLDDQAQRQVHEEVEQQNIYLKDHPRSSAEVAARKIQKTIKRLDLSGHLSVAAEGRTLILKDSLA